MARLQRSLLKNCGNFHTFLFKPFPYIFSFTFRIIYRCKSNGAKIDAMSNFLGGFLGEKHCTEPEVDPPVSPTCQKLYRELALGNMKDLMHHTVMRRVLNETTEFRINNEGRFMS